VAHQEVLVGATIQLQCMAEGTSPITWQWRNNTILVLGDGRVRVNDGQLTISNAQVSDSGVYQCIASHSTSGQDGTSNSVTVTSKKEHILCYQIRTLKTLATYSLCYVVYGAVIEVNLLLCSSLLQFAYSSY